MEKNNYFSQCFLIFLIILFSVNSTFAQQIDIMPVSPEIAELKAKQMLSETPSSDLPADTESKIEQSSTLSEAEQPPFSPLKQNETEKPVTGFEGFVTGRAPVGISTNISQFGYGLFSKSSSGFAPSGNVPVGPNFVIGPGDGIRVTIWGKVEGTWNVVVDRDGNISLPKIGVIGVTGLTFMELKDLIHKEFKKYYTGFQMNVSMGALRSIRVYIIGNAVSPGAYTVSSFSTLINALFEARGPSTKGSMRDIQVKRNGETIIHFDMYDFLMKGDKTKDIRLMPEDVIFVPPVGTLAGIAGQVNKPAIYEQKGETRITDLIAMSGGITATGYLKRIQVERILEKKARILVDTSIEELSGEKDLLLRDRDIVKIFPISSTIVNAVTLKGNVSTPGKYQWHEGLKVSDIIKDPERDLMSETYYDHALIERTVPPDYHKEIISFNLGKALFEKDAEEDRTLTPYDVLTVYSQWEFKEKPLVRIAGALNKPGTYSLQPNMDISDLINLAGGFKRYAYLKEAELTRVEITQEGPITEKLVLDLENIHEAESGSNITLKEDDYLFVRTIPEWKLYQTATITGEVKFPGTYTFQKGETLSSLIERAGGYAENAYLRGALFTREQVRQVQQKSINEMVERMERDMAAEGAVRVATALSSDEVTARQVELQQQQKFIVSLKHVKATGRMAIRLMHLRLLKNSEYDFTLEEGDKIHIPVKSSMINVVGSVMSRGGFIYSSSLDYKDYIDMSGGFTKYADESNVYVIKVDGTAIKLKKGAFNWSSSRSRWEMSAFSKESNGLEPGDAIVVPEKLDRIAWLREIKDLTQILYQIAVTAGVAVAVF